jgi:hypothetical protein
MRPDGGEQCSEIGNSDSESDWRSTMVFLDRFDRKSRTTVIDCLKVIGRDWMVSREAGAFEFRDRAV